MKQKKKHVIFAVCFVVVLGIIGLLYAVGFRITYAPGLENSWDAISACASWAGVIVSITAVGVSGLAVYYAIQVPKTIANRQDKIALFEKRLEFYDCINKCLSFSRVIENEISVKMIQVFFVASFDKEEKDKLSKSNLDSIDMENLARTVIICSHQIQTILMTGNFLFDFETEKLITKLRLALNCLMSTDTKNTSESLIITKKTAYRKAANDINDILLEPIKESLRLQK